MFKKLFSKNKKADVVKQDSGDITLLGSPYGEDIGRLEYDISERLKTVREVTTARLSMVQYNEDEAVNLGLIISTDTAKAVIIPKLVEACSALVPMHIMFWSDLKGNFPQDTLDKCRVFYRAGQ